MYTIQNLTGQIIILPLDVELKGDDSIQVEDDYAEILEGIPNIIITKSKKK